jgi:hypothetical protein
MKIKPLLCGITLLCLSIAQAQYPCFNGISTNPSNPINNQLPTKRNTFFNWQDSLWAMQPSPFCFRTALNESPFYKIDNAEELRESKDMFSDDGWELLRRQVGLTETNAFTASNPEQLYVILYNRYTGILRIIMQVCRGQDYGAAKFELKFAGTSTMRTDLLELSRGQMSALDKQFSNTEFAAGVKFLNENTKYFYADFPMVFDPCTCNYKSKLNILTKLISNATINIEGGITGEAHTQSTGGAAQVQKPGTFSWKNFTSTVNGKLTAINGSIDQFRSLTQKLATNYLRTDPKDKSDAIGKLAEFMKTNRFLTSGLTAIPWLSSAIGVIDVFAAGGRKAGGPQEVKLMPLSINLTAKLTGNITVANDYYDIVFTNPGSKDAHLDPDIYPYYNEVLGIFNLIKTPTLYVQSNFKLIPDPESGNNIRVTENRYRFDLSTLKYVLNPAAGVTIQNMKAAILIEGQNREYPICAYSDHVIPPDFQYEGKDGITNADKYRTEYYDMICLGSRKFQANSYYNAIAAATPTNPLPDVGCPNAFISKGYVKFMINLKRNNATLTTQNILYVATFPLKVVTDNTLPNFVTDDLCNDSSIVASATVAEVNSLCSSTTLYYTPSRYNRVNRDALSVEQHLEKDGFTISPNPNNGAFTIRLKQQKAILKNIFITNLNGQKVFELNTGNINLETGHNQQLNVQLQSGFYFISCVTDRGILKTKMVVTK